MSLRRPALSLLLLLLSACAGAPREQPGVVRVLVYNIHAGRDAAGADNLERVAEVVRRSGADVALLQEVDRGTERSGGVDQIARLEALTGYHGTFGRTLDYQGGEYGIAILTRRRPLAQRMHPLPVEPAQERAGGSREPRGVLQVVVPTPAGTFDVLNTHLDASGEETYRLQEAGRLRRLVEQLQESGRDVLLGGDLNARPGSAVVELLEASGMEDAWRTCTGSAERGPTFPAAAPDRRIDYLLHLPEMACLEARVLEADASDHRPLLVVLGRTGVR